jgi:hypothetical protein
MTSREINAMLALRGPKYSLSVLAERIQEDKSAVSRVLNYDQPGGRKTPRIREKIERDLGIPAEELWDDLVLVDQGSPVMDARDTSTVG